MSSHLWNAIATWFRTPIGKRPEEPKRYVPPTLETLSANMDRYLRQDAMMNAAAPQPIRPIVAKVCAWLDAEQHTAKDVFSEIEFSFPSGPVSCKVSYCLVTHRVKLYVDGETVAFHPGEHDVIVRKLHEIRDRIAADKDAALQAKIKQVLEYKPEGGAS